MKGKKTIVLIVEQRSGGPWNFSPYKQTFSTTISDKPTKQEIINKIKFLIRKHRSSKDYNDYTEYDYYVKPGVRKSPLTKKEKEDRAIFGRPYPSPPDWFSPKKLTKDDLVKMGFKDSRSDVEKMGSTLKEMRYLERRRR